jgi:hypothetical protein
MDENDKSATEVEDEDSVEVAVNIDAEDDVVIDENPNVKDQLAGASSDSGIGDKKTPTLTAEEKYNKFMEENPDARDIHGKKTSKRIDKITWETKEAERQRDEAIEFAKRTQEEITILKKNQTTQDGAFINEHKSRLETQFDTTKQELANAYNLSDSQGIAEATAKMARLSNQLDIAAQTETRFKRARDEAPEQEAPVYTPPVTQQRPPVDPKAEAWAETNEWFGEDKEMTEAALAIHRTLVTQEGYLPQTNAYYNALDERIRKNYPDSEYFKTVEVGTGPELKSPGSVVTSVNSNGTRASRPGRVHLTASQVRVAKKLGVPLQEYAKSLEAYNKSK